METKTGYIQRMKQINQISQQHYHMLDNKEAKFLNFDIWWSKPRRYTYAINIHIHIMLRAQPSSLYTNLFSLVC